MAETEITLKQQKANRRKWVKALRGGKYKQSKDVLADEDGKYCCLGVLARCAGIKKDRLLGFGTLSDFEEVMTFVGLRTDVGGISSNKSLSSLNDNGASFSEIADIIESEPPGLFVEIVPPAA